MATRTGLAAPLAALLALFAAGCGSGGDAPAAPEVVTTKSGIEMASIPAGRFTMGCDSGEDDEKPAHIVELDAFLIDRYEVTQRHYEKLTGKNPSKWKGPDRPVERASWAAAAKYCNMRSLKDGLKPCYDAKTLSCDFAADGYRLPTEAEWEYACRAGATSAYSFGADPGALPSHAWFKSNAGKATHPVGSRKPNAWGLHDIHGNVAEWCMDFYADDYGAAETPENPRGPDAGDERVLRGGSWRASAESCRSSARFSETPGFADVCFGYEAYGFRCVRRIAAE